MMGALKEMKQTEETKNILSSRVYMWTKRKVSRDEKSVSTKNLFIFKQNRINW